jgi:hypothetical protein
LSFLFSILFALSFFTFVGFVTHLIYVCPYFPQAKHFNDFCQNLMRHIIFLLLTSTYVKYRSRQWKQKCSLGEGLELWGLLFYQSLLAHR